MCVSVFSSDCFSSVAAVVACCCSPCGLTASVTSVVLGSVSCFADVVAADPSGGCVSTGALEDGAVTPWS